MTSYLSQRCPPVVSKHTTTFKITVVATFPVIALIIQNSYLASKEADIVSEMSALQESIQMSLAIGLIIHNMQIERDITTLYSSSKRDPMEYIKLMTQYYQTEEAFLSFYAHDYPNAQRVLDVKYLHVKIKDYRLQFETEKDAPAARVIDFYSNLTAQVVDWLGSSVYSTHNGQMWHSLIAYYLFVMGKEKTGLERAFGIAMLSNGNFPDDLFKKFLANSADGIIFIEKSQLFSKRVNDSLNTFYMSTELEYDITHLRNEIRQKTRSASERDQWFDNMTTYLDILKNIEDELVVSIMDEVNGLSSAASKRKSMSLMVMGLTIVLFPAAFFLVFKLTKTMQSFSNTLQGKTKDLEDERKKIEELLFQILPPSIAQKLIKNESVLPEYYQSVTLFFSDVVGFTAIAAKCSPLQVVELLNNIYKTFDERLELFDAYKVETIGDAYMVVSGLPRRNGDSHSSEICLMALDILKYLAGVKIPVSPNKVLQIRIGINTGPVVAGIVGKKRPRYCLFGETVTIASIIEATGLPCEIHLSESTHRALTHCHGGFEIEERKIKVEIKGKGPMQTYFLTGKDIMLHEDR